MRALLLLALVVVASCFPTAPYDEEDVSDSTYARILGIKQMADETYFPGMEHEPESNDKATIHTLGDTDEDSSMLEAHREEDSRDEGHLVRIDKLIQQCAPETSLGEGKAMGGVTDEELSGVLKGKSAQQVSDTIENVIVYLGNLANDGHKLTPKQMTRVRHWYLDATAQVLGRFAFDDTAAHLPGAVNAHHVGAMRDDAVSAKKDMDKVDAAMHMQKMGAPDHSRGLNVLALIQQTGRLAEFLADIESSTEITGPVHAMHEINPNAPTPEGDEGPVLREQPATSHVSKLAKLQKKEKQITASINLLMKRVADGDPLTGMTNKQISAKEHREDRAVKGLHMPGLKLHVELTHAADKEDKARIVEAAGTLAEKKIMKTMHKATSHHHHDRHPEPEEGREPHSIVIRNAEPMVRVKESADDVSAPIKTLHDHVAENVNNKLTKILKLFKRRHAEHKALTTAQHKKVNHELRTLAANLMRKVSQRDELPPKTTVASMGPPARGEDPDPLYVAPTPKKKVKKQVKKVVKKTVKKAVKKTPTWAHKGEVKVEEKAMAAGHPEAPSATGKTPKKSLVTQFVWHQLGKTKATRTTPPPTLAKLLQQGVRMYGGGTLRFVAPGLVAPTIHASD